MAIVIEQRSDFAGYGQTLAIAEGRSPLLPTAADSETYVSSTGRRSPRTPPRKRGDSLPAVIRNAVERREERVIKAKVKRPKILLIAD